MFLAQDEIVFAVPRSNVNESRARIHFDKVCRQHRHVKIVSLAPPGMGKRHPRHNKS